MRWLTPPRQDIMSTMSASNGTWLLGCPHTHDYALDMLDEEFFFYEDIKILFASDSEYWRPAEIELNATFVDPAPTRCVQWHFCEDRRIKCRFSPRGCIRACNGNLGIFDLNFFRSEMYSRFWNYFDRHKYAFYSGVYNPPVVPQKPDTGRVGCKKGGQRNILSNLFWDAYVVRILGPAYTKSKRSPYRSFYQYVHHGGHFYLWPAKNFADGFQLAFPSDAPYFADKTR